MNNVVQYPGTEVFRTPIGQAIRTGESSYRQIEGLYAEGRLPASTVIVDASTANRQRPFIRSLVDSGVEVILDTKCAELSAPRCFQGYAKQTPWAIVDENRPLRIEDFQLNASNDTLGKIARMAIELGVHSVMSPSHFVQQGANDPWFDVDCRSAALLRKTLDREGGQQIGIDYSLVLPHTLAQKSEQRSLLMEALSPIEFDNLNVRLSGFGADATPGVAKTVLTSISEFQSMGRPIVLDHIGGLIGVAAVAYNYVSGIAQGVGEKTRFSAHDWHKPRPAKNPDDSFGRATYIPVPDLDRSFTQKEMDQIGQTPRGRRLLLCGECEKGLVSMKNEPKAHIAHQLFGAINKLTPVPNIHRAKYFLDHHMRDAERKARDFSDLDVGDASINSRLVKNRKRIDSMAKVFETLIDDPTRSTVPPRTVRRATTVRDHSVVMA